MAEEDTRSTGISAEKEMRKSGPDQTVYGQAKLSELLAPTAVRVRKDYIEIANLSAQLAEQENRNGQAWSQKDTAELTALLAEYDSLRQESLHTINNRARTMILGLAAIGAVLGGSLTIDNPIKHATLLSVLFSIVVPVVSLLVLVIWAGEAMRMKRVSDYLAADLEQRVNYKLGRLVLSWETCLRIGALPRDEIFGPSMYVAAVFSASAFFVPILGLEITKTEWCLIGGGQPMWQLWVPWGLFGLTVFFLLLNFKRLKNNPVIFSSLTDVPPKKRL